MLCVSFRSVSAAAHTVGVAACLRFSPKLFSYDLPQETRAGVPSVGMSLAVAKLFSIRFAASGPHVGTLTRYSLNTMHMELG